MMSREIRTGWLTEECARLSSHPLHWPYLVPLRCSDTKHLIPAREMPALRGLVAMYREIAHHPVSSEPILSEAFRHGPVLPTPLLTHRTDDAPWLSDSSLELPLQVAAFPLDSRVSAG